jgi:chromosome segregation ATPase
MDETEEKKTGDVKTGEEGRIGNIGGEEGKKIITELITHLNSVEEKLKAIKEEISEIKDAELLDKLDIINLSNQLERVKLTMPDITPETKGGLEHVSQLLEKIKDVKTLQKEIEKIEKKLKIEKGEVCPKCGAEVVKGDKFCGKCGVKL